VGRAGLACGRDVCGEETKQGEEGREGSAADEDGAGAEACWVQTRDVNRGASRGWNGRRVAVTHTADGAKSMEPRDAAGTIEGVDLANHRKDVLHAISDPTGRGANSQVPLGQTHVPSTRPPGSTKSIVASSQDAIQASCRVSAGHRGDRV
jgi:hypothetical protein